MNLGDLVKVEDETLDFCYWCEAERSRSKNHYSDLESCADGGVLPDLNMTRGTYTFNPARVYEAYLDMRSPLGDARLMMRAKKSVSFTVYDSKPAGKKRFNLHNPEETICFEANQVIGKQTAMKMCPTLAKIMGMPHCTGGQLRATAIQALRMASFTVEQCAKVSRHKRPSTIEISYDPGLRTNMRANMAAAIAQAPSMKRGNPFVPVDQDLPRKASRASVQFADPKDMVPQRAGRSSVQLSLVMPSSDLHEVERQAGPDLLTQAIEEEFPPEGTAVQGDSHEVVFSLPGSAAPTTSTPCSFGEQERCDIDLGSLFDSSMWPEGNFLEDGDYGEEAGEAGQGGAGGDEHRGRPDLQPAVRPGHRRHHALAALHIRQEAEPWQELPVDPALPQHHHVQP